MEPMLLLEAAQAMHALNSESLSPREARGISIDTRSLKPHDLFFALTGENSDGHLYVRQAFDRGAAAAVVSHKVENAEGIQILVEDPLLALGRLAAAIRSRFTLPVIAVTGSVGKTSTKEMIAAILSKNGKTLVSAHNFNNEIGLPLTLCRLEGSYEAAVLEMGMRGLGQIAYLAEIAGPTIAVITGIGSSHIELLGSRENIARAKAEALSALPPGGTAILPAQSDMLPILWEAVPDGCRIITYGADCEGADMNVHSVQTPLPGRYGMAFSPQVCPLIVPFRVFGIHHVHNAAAALAVAQALDLPLIDAIFALGDWEGAEGRMWPHNAPGDILVLDDCYNAGPESMSAALSSLQHMGNGSRKVAVLGDMKELGEYSREAHLKVGREAAERRLGLLITVGELAEGIAQGALEGTFPPEQILSFPDTETAAARINDVLQVRDVVLVKGSRAMGMERIVKAIVELNEGEAEA